MNEPYRRLIDFPSAWTPAQIGGRKGALYGMAPEHLDAIDELLGRTRHLAPQQVSREHFDHPALHSLIATLRQTLKSGTGILIVGGLTPERYSEEQFQRVFWGLGTHLGKAVVQNRNGDCMARVERDDNPHSRGYRGDHELKPHTDSFEWIGLMCVRQGESGGLSGVASTLAVHNEFLKHRPELLAPLYEGYEYALPELRDSAKPITDMKIPVFCNVDGHVSCMIIEHHMRNAAEAMGVAFPPELDEALNYFQATVARQDISMHFMLEPGDMMFLNNFTTIHSRTAFANSARHRRLLLRLWLNVPDGRPVVAGLRARAKAYEWHFQANGNKQADLLPAR